MKSLLALSAKGLNTGLRVGRTTNLAELGTTQTGRITLLLKVDCSRVWLFVAASPTHAGISFCPTYGSVKWTPGQWNEWPTGLNVPHRTTRLLTRSIRMQEASSQNSRRHRPTQRPPATEQR